MDKKLEALEAHQTTWGVKLYLLSKILLTGIFQLGLFSLLMFLLLDMCTKRTMPHGSYFIVVFISFLINDRKNTIQFIKDVFTGKCSNPIVSGS